MVSSWTLNSHSQARPDTIAWDADWVKPGQKHAGGRLATHWKNNFAHASIQQGPKFAFGIPLFFQGSIFGVVICFMLKEFLLLDVFLQYLWVPSLLVFQKFVLICHRFFSYCQVFWAVPCSFIACISVMFLHASRNKFIHLFSTKYHSVICFHAHYSCNIVQAGHPRATRLTAFASQCLGRYVKTRKTCLQKQQTELQKRNLHSILSHLHI